MKKIVILLMVIPLFLIHPINKASAEESAIQEEIIYDILVDRFNNGNQQPSEQVRLDDPYAYHGGDIKGIVMKLDELKKLGFTTISLSPIMDNAPDGYHGYWVEDFYEVDEEFGTMQDIKLLVEEAHKRDMKVILEFVSNYVAESHPIVTDPDKKDWIKETTRVDHDSYPWLENVRTLNQDNPEVESYLFDVATYWINETQIDGLKLHAADQSSPEFLEKFTAHLKDLKPDLYIIADLLLKEGHHEINEIDDIQLVENVLLYETMTEVFSKPDQPVKEIYEQWQASDNKSGLLYVDNKYTKRFTQKFMENGRNKVTVWKLALTYMYTTPGVPLIYQGSEIPMYGAGFPDNQRLVDFNSGDAEIKEFMERISALRSEFPALSYGDFELVDSDQGMSVFKRSYQDETIYIAINNDSESRAIAIEGIDSNLQLRGLLGDNLVRENKAGEFRIGIPRETAEVYITEENSGLNWAFIGVFAGIFLLFVFVIIYLSLKEKRRNKG